MPIPLAGSQALLADESLYLIGGENAINQPTKSIYKVRKITDTCRHAISGVYLVYCLLQLSDIDGQWEKVSVSLDIERAYHLSIAIPWRP